jgi:hypothetical protein
MLSQINAMGLALNFVVILTFHLLNVTTAAKTGNSAIKMHNINSNHPNPFAAA